MTFGFGAATTFISLLITIVLMQMFGNMSQGPANALIVDNVPVSRMGEASGTLNFARVLGAGILTIVVLFMMGNYRGSDSELWLWASITLMVAVLLGSTLWTVLSLKPAAAGNPMTALLAPKPIVKEMGRWQRRREALLIVRNRRTYYMFLVAMTFVIAAMSAMQVYALFFMEDVVGLANPERDTGLVVLVIAGATLAVVIPAGSMADRLGHEKLLVVAGILGAAGALLLLLVQSLVGALLVGVIIGLAVGIFLSVTWALANSLVSQITAARDLGWTSVATLVGAAIARISGLGIDALNNQSENLGYDAVIVGVAAAFVIASLMMIRVSGLRRDTMRTRPGPRGGAQGPGNAAV
jgi:Na+/melibiose symporter-like transporter